MTGRRALAALLLVLPLACTADRETQDLRGSRVEVMATWSGTEQERFVAVLQAFERRSGAAVTYTSAQHRITDALDERAAGGRLPDVALLPQPGLLQGYARAGALVPLDPGTRAEVTAHYAPRWVELASSDGTVYGVWLKAANKSLVWYDVAAFETLGLAPPADLAGLRRAAQLIRRAQGASFAVSPGDGWTLTDWFENLYLRLAGPQKYDLLAAHRVPWTDASVEETLRVLSELLDPSLTTGGPATTFEDAVGLAFGKDSRAAMLVEGDFVAGAISSRTSARLGVDVDVFPFPAAAATGRDAAIVCGGDVAVILRESAAAQALLRYLATPEAASVWARYGGFVSPNGDVDLSVYPDELSRRLARSVLDAGNDFHFDLSDLQPAAFGGREAAGLRAELRRFLAERDVGATARRLERQADAAHLTANGRR